MSRWSPLTVIVCTAVAFLIGCSSGNNPISPDSTDLTPAGTVQNFSPNSILWGFYSVNLEPDSGNFEIIPIRGMQFQANVTRFLQPPDSPVHMLSIAIDAIIPAE